MIGFILCMCMANPDDISSKAQSAISEAASSKWFEAKAPTHDNMSVEWQNAVVEAVSNIKKEGK